MNAKTELQDILRKIGTPVQCAFLNDVLLKVGHTSLQLETFLNHFDFDYDEYRLGTNGPNGFYHIWGNVWLRDGSWLERQCSNSDYDAEECWVHQRCPPIPLYLLMKS